MAMSSTRKSNAHTVVRRATGARLPFLEYSDAAQRETYAGRKALLPEIAHIGKVRYRQALAELPEHRHVDSLELCYIVRGTLDWEMERKVFGVKANDIFIARPNAWHGGCWSMMQPCELYFIQVRAVHGNSFINERLAELEKTPIPCFSGSPALGTFFDRLMDECRNPSPDSRGLMQAELASLLSHAIRHSHRTRNFPRNQFSPPIQHILEYIHKNPDQWPTAHDWVKISGLGRSQLFERFRRETGSSLQEYVQQSRLMEAKRLLRETKRAATQTAFALGFSSSQYFATVFRKRFGLSPTEYAQRQVASPSRT